MPSDTPTPSVGNAVTLVDGNNGTVIAVEEDTLVVGLYGEDYDARYRHEQVTDERDQGNKAYDAHMPKRTEPEDEVRDHTDVQEGNDG